jgi:hypothetical protein
MPFYFFTEYLNNNKINHYRFWFSWKIKLSIWFMIQI